MMKYNITNILGELRITEIHFDSRNVTPGSAFFCIQYTQHYVDEAFHKGAALVVTNMEPYIANPKILVVDNVRQALAIAAANLYPLKPENVVAVTGTSGKSSVVDYFRQIAGYLGFKAASIGTIGVACSDPSLNISQFTSDLTTPDVITMHKILAFLASKGVTHVAFEASSHGIEQKRIGEIFVKAAGFTSFSQDHLDYHNTMEAYKFAKLKLFTENLIPGGTAAIADEVMDDDVRSIFSGTGLLSNESAKVLTIGKNGAIKILSAIPAMTGQQIVFLYKNKEYNISTSIVGSFQATNLLIAAGMLEACGVDFTKIASVLHKVVSVPGRLERVTPIDNSWHVFVDYSHKPGALMSSLNEMRLLCKNELHVLFGCGGDRDKTKRAQMGEIAARIADNIIISDDNPRTEDASIIRAEIMKGCPKAQEIAGRGEAIKYTISQLKAGDVLLIAGKGDEDYQIIGTRKIHFDDREEARKYL